MTKRKDYLTVLNVMSALAVVYLHSNSFWTYTQDADWVLYNIIECIFYFAVPIFFMISGATLIGYRKRNTTREFFKKRVIKAVIPFIFWSVFSLGFGILMQSVKYGKESINYNAYDIINMFTYCKFPFNSIYWFFPVLFTSYMFMPILSAIDESKKKSVFEYIIISSLVVNVLLPFIISFFQGEIGYSGGFYFIAGLDYATYLVLGYYIDNYEIKINIRIIIYIFGALGLLAHFFGTWWLSSVDGSINDLFKEYINLPAITYSTALFLLFKNINFNNAPKFIMNIIYFFRSQTFGVYLTHYFIIVLIDIYCPIVDTDNHFYKLLAPVVIFTIASLLIRLLQKIPVVKKIVP